MKKILVGITGAVAATVMPSYVLQIRRELNVETFVLVSKNATKFVTPYSLRVHSGNEVFTDIFQSSQDVLVPHIKLTSEADALIIMPATANIIAKIAHGFCDDIISTSVVASKCPVILVPSMNANMWFDHMVQQNVKKILACGYYVIEPQKGLEVGDLSNTFGVMPGIQDVIMAIREIVNRSKVVEN